MFSGLVLEPSSLHFRPQVAPLFGHFLLQVIQIVLIKVLLGFFEVEGGIAQLDAKQAGDVVSVGDGVSELRIHFGPGCRVYFRKRGNEIVVLLCGGDKGSQDRDVATAKRLAQNLEEFNG